MSCLVYDTSIKSCNFNIQLLNCLPATNSSPLKYSMAVKWGWISWHHWHYYSPGTTTYRAQHISIFIYIFFYFNLLIKRYIFYCYYCHFTLFVPFFYLSSNPYIGFEWHNDGNGTIKYLEKQSCYVRFVEYYWNR